MKGIIEEGGYTPEQVLNVDQTGLYWKHMPNKYIYSEEKSAYGFKATKDCLTLLLRGNAAVDFKLKPLPLCHSENPWALKGYSKSHLPVIWQSNVKALVTQAFFSDWFTLHLCPAVKDYCTRENQPHKIMLVLDNAPEHPVNLIDLSENVKVTFLPPNTTPLLQSMDQKVIATFKAYVRHTFR